MKEAGTRYHLHFDIQCRRRWLGVRQSLRDAGAAYERLIGRARTELTDANVWPTPIRRPPDRSPSLEPPAHRYCTAQDAALGQNRNKARIYIRQLLRGR